MLPSTLKDHLFNHFHEFSSKEEISRMCLSFPDSLTTQYAYRAIVTSKGFNPAAKLSLNKYGYLSFSSSLEGIRHYLASLANQYEELKIYLIRAKVTGYSIVKLCEKIKDDQCIVSGLSKEEEIIVLDDTAIGEVELLSVSYIWEGV